MRHRTCPHSIGKGMGMCELPVGHSGTHAGYWSAGPWEGWEQPAYGEVVSQPAEPCACSSCKLAMARLGMIPHDRYQLRNEKEEVLVSSPKLVELRCYHVKEGNFIWDDLHKRMVDPLSL